MFFKDVNIASTTKTNAKEQADFAKNSQALVDANRGVENVNLDTSRLKEGRQNADFWQGNKQNLTGVRNVGNGANTAADLGQSFSVMEGAGDAMSASENSNRVARKAGRSVADMGFAQQFKTGANQMQFDQDVFDAQNEFELQNGTLNAINSGINGAVSGFMMGNEFFNKGGAEKLATDAKQVGQNWKTALDADGKTLGGTLGTFRDLNNFSFNGGVEAFADRGPWSGFTKNFAHTPRANQTGGR
jgi:hypothetical protein